MYKYIHAYWYLHIHVYTAVKRRVAEARNKSPHILNLPWRQTSSASVTRVADGHAV